MLNYKKNWKWKIEFGNGQVFKLYCWQVDTQNSTRPLTHTKWFQKIEIGKTYKNFRRRSSFLQWFWTNLIIYMALKTLICSERIIAIWTSLRTYSFNRFMALSIWPTYMGWEYLQWKLNSMMIECWGFNYRQVNAIFKTESLIPTECHRMILKVGS